MLSYTQHIHPSRRCIERQFCCASLPPGRLGVIYVCMKKCGAGHGQHTGNSYSYLQHRWPTRKATAMTRKQITDYYNGQGTTWRARRISCQLALPTSAPLSEVLDAL